VLKVLLHISHLVPNCHVLIRTDSVSAAAYGNRQGGVRSSALHLAEVKLWLWSHRNLLSLRALHIPGALMSCGCLYPNIVRLIWRRFAAAQVELFASTVNTHGEMWFSICLHSRPLLGVDAMVHAPWPRMDFVCVTATTADPPSFREGSTGESVTHSHGARESVGPVVPRAARTLVHDAVAGFRWARCAVTGPRIDSPPAISLGTIVDLAPERLILQGRNLPAAVINSIQSACAPSTSSLYKMGHFL